MPSPTEENYLKIIFHHSGQNVETVSTNTIAAALGTTPASVTDMLKRLSEKGLIEYARYKGVTLTPEGMAVAVRLVRSHRLWEVFLVEKLGFSWDEVHPIAEELEHVPFPELVRRLDVFLGKPSTDPHGDPIPNEDGVIKYPKHVPIAELLVGQMGVVTGVSEHSASFLKHLGQHSLVLGVEAEVLERFDYDQSMRIKINGGMETIITAQVCRNLLVEHLPILA